MLQGKELVNKSLIIATEAHAGQYRRDKVTPYITHPIAVAEKLVFSTGKSIALLHDVLEDSDITIANLIEQDIPPIVVNIVVILTKFKSEKYLDYILRVKDNTFATLIKIEDIKHNYPTSHKSKQERYDMALYILKGKTK